ncbi:efflux RND transporter periplasmic adaptor subunit [Sphingomonas jatrophae]|uniref:RND family efflux transporter, MFP subunit n=1 Tax=Sphingomonas jatrophae TaxID=1166337 RepID=A0A1I6JS55_9SPHN|nr:efflux RND transporter periplasmic adaptor subunit [Sphingomonas jatrophae]SFR81814.1 RND family efflux transporter, MFP subunit [Sphingomonas jatrophae]
MYLSDVKGDPAGGTPTGVASETRARRRRLAWLALPAGGLLLFGAYRLTSGDPVAAPPPPPSVTVSAPLVRQVAEWDDYVGRFEASQAVEIRPRVSGALESIRFKDGDVVRKGQLLFTIDPRPFVASLREAQARAQSAVTALALARSELKRAERLVADQAVSAEEVDSLRARAQSAVAALAAARAQVEARRLDVEFTQVRAPISGRISDRRVDIGNLVSGDSASSATVLTTINALDPIYFAFDGSEALYLKQRRAKQGAAEVQVRLQDETGYRWQGRVDFVDNAIDRGSGTIRGRAVIRNPDYFLTPGMFGNMRMGEGGYAQALLVPDAAVVTDIGRKTVFVVEGGKAVAKPVTAGPLVAGLRVIRGGLKPTDRVIISGTQNAQPGAPVSATAGRIEAAPEAPDTPASGPAASQATLAAR